MCDWEVCGERSRPPTWSIPKTRLGATSTGCWECRLLALRRWCSILSGDGWDGGKSVTSITGSYEPCSWILPAWRQTIRRVGSSVLRFFGGESPHRGERYLYS